MIDKKSAYFNLLANMRINLKNFMTPVSVPVTASTARGSHGSDTSYHCHECGLRDQGSPMIGCDGYDSWIHWGCAGITREPPEDEKWYCPTCVETRRAGKKKKEIEQLIFA